MKEMLRLFVYLFVFVCASVALSLSYNSPSICVHQCNYIVARLSIVAYHRRQRGRHFERKAGCSN